MSYRYLEQEDGMQKLMLQFAPPPAKPIAERRNQIAMNFQQIPQTPYEWNDFDCCAGDAAANIPRSLTKSVFDEQVLGDTQIKWDDNENAFSSALFPVVIRFSTGERAKKATDFREEVADTYDTHAFPCMYRVCVSRFKPVVGKQIPHNPQWKEINLHSIDEEGVAVDGVTKSKVYVDSSLIGDAHCARSIVASLENSSIRAESYVYMFAEVTEEIRKEINLPFNKTDDHKISGASLGMAVFAACQGWPSILYTGYTSFILPGYKIQNNSAYSQAARAGKPVPEYWKGTAPGKATFNHGVEVYSDSYVRMAKQIDFVDTVQDLPYKMLLAVFHKIPIIVPMAGPLGETTAKFIQDAQNMYRRNLLSFYQLTYTMANAERGMPTVIEGQGIRAARLLYMGKTIAEFMILAYMAQAAQSLATSSVEKYGEGRVLTFENAWKTNRIKRGLATSAAAQRVRDANDELKQQVESQQITPEVYKEKKIQMAKNRLAVKKAKKNSTKMASRESAEKRSKIKQVIQEAQEKYEENYALAKAGLGYKPKGKDLAEFNRSWPSPNAAKKRMNLQVFKNLVGTNIIDESAKGTSTASLVSRYNKAKELVDLKTPVPIIYATLNIFFKALATTYPIPYDAASDAGIDGPAFLLKLKKQITDIMGTNDSNFPVRRLTDNLYQPNRDDIKLRRERAMKTKRGVGVDMAVGGDDEMGGDEEEEEDERNQNDEPATRNLSVAPDGTATAEDPQEKAKRRQEALRAHMIQWRTQNPGATQSERSAEVERFQQSKAYVDAGAKFNSVRFHPSSAGQFGAAGHFGSAAKHRQDSKSHFKGAGRLIGAPSRRITGRPSGDEIDASSWGFFDLLDDIGKGVGTVAKGAIKGIETVGKVANAAAPLIGAGMQLAKKF